MPGSDARIRHGLPASRSSSRGRRRTGGERPGDAAENAAPFRSKPREEPHGHRILTFLRDDRSAVSGLSVDYGRVKGYSLARGEGTVVSVHLRPTSPEDLDFVLDAERDPENARFILPWTREQHARALADPDVAHRIIELGSARDRVGFVLLLGLTSPHGSLEFR
jgi:hypothetical protein